MTTKRLEKEFKDEEIEAWVQEFRRACLEVPDPNEEKFPSNPEDIHAYIRMLEELIEKKPTQELKVELRLYKAVLSGAFIGHATATEGLMRRTDDIQHAIKEDKKANELLDKKVIGWLEKEKEKNPNRMISKKKMLQVARLTKKELKAGGIENIERYVIKRKRKEVKNEK